MLDDIRVIELATMITAPLARMMLATAGSTFIHPCRQPPSGTGSRSCA